MSLEFDFAEEGGSGNGSSFTINNESCIMLETVQTGKLHYHAFVLGVIVIFSIIGNSLVLTLFLRFKELRTRSGVVNMSMVVADFLFTLAYTLQVIVTTVKAGWVFGDLGCKIFGFLASDLLITRWLILSLLCLDRFLTVRFPFSYHQRRGTPILITFTALAWFVPLLVSIIPSLAGFVTYELREQQPACLPGCKLNDFGCRAYYFLVFTILYILGSIVPIVLYSWLYCKARRLKKSTNHTLGRLTVEIASGIVISQPVGEKNSKDKRDKQATITIILIITTVVVTGTPGYILQVVRALSSSSMFTVCQIPILFHFIVIEFFLCAPMLTPLLIMRDITFRRCLVKLFCSCRRKTGDLEVRKSPAELTMYNQSRRSSIAPTVTQESSSSSESSPDSETRLQVSYALKPTVYTISESCESLSQTEMPSDPT